MWIHLNSLLLVLLAGFFIPIEARSVFQGSAVNTTDGDFVEQYLRTIFSDISSGINYQDAQLQYSLFETPIKCKEGYVLQGNHCRQEA